MVCCLPCLKYGNKQNSRYTLFNHVHWTLGQCQKQDNIAWHFIVRCSEILKTCSMIKYSLDGANREQKFTFWEYSRTPFLTLQGAHSPRFLFSQVSEHRKAVQGEQKYPIINKNTTVRNHLQAKQDRMSTELIVYTALFDKKQVRATKHN